MNARDRTLLEQILAREPNLKAFSAGRDVDIEGGVTVESKDGTLQLDLQLPDIPRHDMGIRTGVKTDLLFG